jgi:probable F420-dependent oxidoreductase
VREKPTGIGIRIPTTGEVPGRLGIGAMAAAVERSGASSVWTGDHIVFTREYTSKYPYSPDGTGRMTWDLETTYHDTMLSLAMMAGATSRVELGTAVLVLPMRNPVEFAKVAASLDVLSGGRLVLGVGVGWLAEEFEALGIDFGARGARFDEAIEILDRLWSGDETPFVGKAFQLPAGVISRPLPERGEPPRLLVGGHGRRAVERARRLGGWLGITQAAAPDFEGIEEAIAALGDREPSFSIVLRVLGPACLEPAFADHHARLRALGVDLVILDVPWGTVAEGEDAVAHLVRHLT